MAVSSYENRMVYDEMEEEQDGEAGQRVELSKKVSTYPGKNIWLYGHGVNYM